MTAELTPTDTTAAKKKRQRTDKPTVTFMGGYADGWFMAVRDCFRESFDILLTERVSKTKGLTLTLTEGIPPLYAFATGDTFYNSKSGYEKEWGEALKEITVGLQVSGGQPDQWDGQKKIPGWVHVSEYRPNADRSGITEIAQHRMTQDEFVATLKTGVLPNGMSL